MKELVVVSGKGGTGKTSIIASFARLAEKAVFADCDVDASNLYLVMRPKVVRSEEFKAGAVAKIDRDACTGCGDCVELCRFDAIINETGRAGEALYTIDKIACEGCGVCAHFCPEKAIELEDTVSGEWFVSDTREGPMVHARLGIAEENSGKLVTLIRKEARRIAEERELSLILSDGSPGIGCPVIASITGADIALLVAEPTLSGMHDVDRVAELASGFGVQSLLCVNKWDLNPEMTESIESAARDRGVLCVGRVPYDPEITRSQIEEKSIIEIPDALAAQAVRALWNRIEEHLQENGKVA